MPARHPWLRHARSRAAAACAALAVVSFAPISTTPAVAAEPIATSITASPGRATKTVGTTATFVFTLGTGRARVVGRTVNIYTKKAGATRWDRSWVKTTNRYGQVAARFTVTKSTYVRANFYGDSTYGPSQSINAFVEARPAFGSQVVTEASTHRGKPYQWGATGPYRFDCSGFTLYVFGKFGKSLPHNSGQQYQSVRHIAKSDKRVGDLIFTYGSGGIYHVGIYAGNGEIWHSPHSGDVVKRSAMWSSSYYVGRVA